jgi:hypothetical protein
MATDDLTGINSNIIGKRLYQFYITPANAVSEI